MMLEGDKPIICAGKSGLVRCGTQTRNWQEEIVLGKPISIYDTYDEKPPDDDIVHIRRSWSMGEEEPCIMCGVAMFYTKSCWTCPSCGFREGCG